MANLLWELGLGVRFGTMYAVRLHDDLNAADHGGFVRASLLHYNSASDVDALLDGLQHIVKRHSRKTRTWESSNVR